MNLKAFIVNEGMTMKQFAALLDISPAYLSAIINGHKQPAKRLARDIDNIANGATYVKCQREKPTIPLSQEPTEDCEIVRPEDRSL